MPLPTKLRIWIKDNMRLVEYGLLDADKTTKLMDFVQSAEGTSLETEISKIIDELALEHNNKPT